MGTRRLWGRGRLWLAGAVALAVLVGGALALRHSPAETAAPALDPTPAPTPTSAATPTASPTPAVRRAPGCPTTARPFVPTSFRVPGVDRSISVVTPPRVGGIPGTPPVSTAGKTVMALDLEQHVLPGARHGHVLLNAHTWPDGSALGNHLLAGLQVGDRVVAVRGHRTLCYRVDERIEVLASQGYPPFYRTDGPPRLAIIVCSGRRIGPENWEKRTIWFARPSA